MRRKCIYKSTMNYDGGEGRMGHKENNKVIALDVWDYKVGMDKTKEKERRTYPLDEKNARNTLWDVGEEGK